MNKQETREKRTSKIENGWGWRTQRPNEGGRSSRGNKTRAKRAAELLTSQGDLTADERCRVKRGEDPTIPLSRKPAAVRFVEKRDTNTKQARGKREKRVHADTSTVVNTTPTINQARYILVLSGQCNNRSLVVLVGGNELQPPSGCCGCVSIPDMDEKHPRTTNAAGIPFLFSLLVSRPSSAPGTFQTLESKHSQGLQHQQRTRKTTQEPLSFLSTNRWTKSNPSCLDTPNRPSRIVCDGPTTLLDDEVAVRSRHQHEAPRPAPFLMSKLLPFANCTPPSPVFPAQSCTDYSQNS